MPSISFGIATNLQISGTLTLSAISSSMLRVDSSGAVSTTTLQSNLSLSAGTLSLSTTLTSINSVTSVAGQNLVLAVGTGGTALTITSSTLAATFGGTVAAGGSFKSPIGYLDIAGTTGFLFSGTSSQFYSGGSNVASIYSDGISVLTTTVSTSTTTGSLINAGGFGNAGAAYIGGQLNLSGSGSAVLNATTSPSSGSYTLFQVSSSSKGIIGTGDAIGGGTPASDIGLYSYTGAVRIFSAGALALNLTSTPGALVLGPASSITAAASTDLTLAGGSSGASLVLGQGASGRINGLVAVSAGIGYAHFVNNVTADTANRMRVTFGPSSGFASAPQLAPYIEGVTIDAATQRAAVAVGVYDPTGATTREVARFTSVSGGTGNLLIGGTTDRSNRLHISDGLSFMGIGKLSDASTYSGWCASDATLSASNYNFASEVTNTATLIGTGASGTIYLRVNNANMLSVNSTATTVAGNLTVSGTGPHNFAGYLNVNRANNTSAGGVWMQTNGTNDWFAGERTTGDSDYHIFNFGTAANAVTILRADSSVALAGTLTVNGTVTGDSQGGVGAIIGSSTKYVQIGYDATNDYGFIESVQTGVSWKTLRLQGISGRVIVGSGVDDTTSLLQVTGTVSVTSLTVSGGNIFSAGTSSSIILNGGDGGAGTNVVEFKRFDGTSLATYVRGDGALYLGNTVASTSTTTGALVVSGGVGVAGAAYIGGSLALFGSAFTHDFGGTGPNRGLVKTGANASFANIAAISLNGDLTDAGNAGLFGGGQANTYIQATSSGSVIIRTNGNTIAATFDNFQNTTLASNLTVSGTGTSFIGGVGTGTTDARLTINTGDTAIYALKLSNWTGSATSNAPRIAFDNSAVRAWSIGAVSASTSFSISDESGGTVPFVIASTGNITLTGTLTVGGASIGSGILNTALTSGASVTGSITPASGSSLELLYGAVADTGSIISYNRTGGAYRALKIDGLTLALNVDSAGLTTVGGNLTVSGYNSISGSVSTTSSGSLGLRLGIVAGIPTNGTDAYIGVNDTGGPGTGAGSLVYVPRTTSTGNAGHYFLTESSGTPTLRVTIDSTGLTVDAATIHKKGQAWGATSTATAAGTTTLTSVSRTIQVFTGTSTQTVQLPAATALGLSVGIVYVIKNRSTGNVTVLPAGSDTIDGSSSFVLTGGSNQGIILMSDGINGWQVV
jgi:hypothetical protein